MRIMIVTLVLGMSVANAFAGAAPAPKDNPIATFDAQNPKAVPDWIGKLPWERVVAMADCRMFRLMRRYMDQLPAPTGLGWKFLGAHCARVCGYGHAC